jgi:hypothetical protein
LVDHFSGAGYTCAKRGVSWQLITIVDAMKKYIVVALAAAVVLPAFAQLKMPAQKPPAAEAAKPRVSAQQQPGPPDPAVIERVFGCLAPNLPKEWKKTWVVVTAVNPGEVEGRFEVKTFYALSATDQAGLPLKPCGWEPIVEGFYELNQNLAEDRRAWKSARLTITSEGKFELTYDYSK